MSIVSSKVLNALGEEVEDLDNMERWVGSVAVVTGASSGIGAAICEKLLFAKINVVGLDRRLYPRTLQNHQNSSYVGKLYSLQCDLSEEENIKKAFEWIENNLGPISILVNNAAILFPTTLIDGDIQMWKTTLDVNVIALAICTREAIKSMQKHGIAGQIVLINSICGHFIPRTSIPRFNVYASTKYAITSFTENLRRELYCVGSKIKVSMISPGGVNTSLNYNFTVDDLDASALNPDDVANSCMYILGTPRHVAVHDLMLRVVGEKL